MPRLALSNVEVVYDKVFLAIRGISLEVEEGDIVALLGANGAGKSTTLKTISGLLAPERGAVTRGEVTFGDVWREHDADGARWCGKAAGKLWCGEQHFAAGIAVVGIDGGNRQCFHAMRRRQGEAVARSDSLGDGKLFIDKGSLPCGEVLPGSIAANPGIQQWPARH